MVVPDGASLFETSIPLGIFGRDYTDLGGPAFDLTVCAIAGSTAGVLAPPLHIGGLARLDELVERRWDTVIVPTWPVDPVADEPTLTDALVTWHDAGARLVGLCLGAFAIAATGVLDGRSAVTHWTRQAEFVARHPDVRFDPRPLYIDHGDVVTSAGSAAAIDCCLHLIREHEGSDAAAVVAAGLVTAPHRTGNQAQSATHRTAVTDDSWFGPLLDAATTQIAVVRTVGDLAVLGSVNRRTLERAFRRHLDISPLEWLTHTRLDTARRVLESTDASVENVARDVGFASAGSMRRSFSQHLETTPTTYRREFDRRTT